MAARRFDVRWMIGMFLVGSLTACSRGASGPRAPAVVESAATSEVGRMATAFLARYHDAYEHLDAPAALALYAPGADTVSVVQGHALRGFESIGAERKAFFGRVSAIHLRVGEPQVTALGGRAVGLMVPLAREYTEGAITLVEEGTLTLTLVRADAGWQIAVEHFSYSLR